ncbi:hypothetical protein TNCV_319441 [Trichonephila clavipes]|nr:hypothetical protein TNCV_319441 [Trichonephila clavipes]
MHQQSVGGVVIVVEFESRDNCFIGWILVTFGCAKLIAHTTDCSIRFCFDENGYGYHFNIKTINPQTGDWVTSNVLERHAAGCIPLNGKKEDCHMHIFWFWLIIRIAWIKLIKSSQQKYQISTLILNLFDIVTKNDP